MVLWQKIYKSIKLLETWTSKIGQITRISRKQEQKTVCSFAQWDELITLCLRNQFQYLNYRVIALNWFNYTPAIEI